MSTVMFAKAFRRHVECPDESIDGTATVGAALDAYFSHHPQVRGYVVDDAGRIRKHLTLFVDGTQITHVDALTTPLTDSSTVHLFQALSGG